MDLIRGANTLIVPAADDETHSILVGIRWADTDLELNISAFAVDADRRVISDEHFVFFNNPFSPERAMWLLEPMVPTVADRAQVGVVLDALPAEVDRVIVTLAITSEGNASFAQMTGLEARVSSLQTGAELAVINPAVTFRNETLINVVEIYRHRDGWKARAVLQGYDSGLAGIATELGIEVG